MKKILLTLIVVSILITAVFFLFMKKDNVNNDINTLPQATTTVVSTFPNTNINVSDEPTFILQNDEGEETEVNNFLQGSSTVKDEHNPGYYFLGNTFFPNEAGDVPNYVILYDNTAQFFNITLLREPLNKSRFEAEDYLRKILKMSDESICDLQYTVSVPAYVNEEMSGSDYRFSFCSGSIRL